LVGGEVVNGAYIENVASEEACIEECNKLEQCNAVNYWAEFGDCLPQIQTLANAEEKDSLSSREEPGTNYIVVKGCNGPIEKPANILPAVEGESEQPEETDQPERRKRNADCRKENLFVGGTWSNDYIFDVKSEEACIEECNKLDNCTAVNYFPLHEACLPQVENTVSDSSIESREEENTVYVIVKGCKSTRVGPGRRKRQAACKLENVLVGGEVVNGAYIENVASEEACIEECNKLEQCNAINYWAEFGDCLPQIQTLADPEWKDRLSSREEPGTNYVVVKNCNGPIEKPANILPAVTDEPEQPEPTEASEPEVSTEEQTSRRKRDASCKLQDVLVGGEVVNNAYIENVASEEACVEECNKLEQCNAVNYFPEPQVCLPQVQTLANAEEKDSLASREEPGTVYVVVKGCNGPIEKPANILPPVKRPEEPEQPQQAERRKRQTGCRLEDVLVGGEVVNNAYIENIETEEACIEECNKLEQCNAVNYFPNNKACLPQIQTLANAEEKDGLASPRNQAQSTSSSKTATDQLRSQQTFSHQLSVLLRNLNNQNLLGNQNSQNSQNNQTPNPSSKEMRCKLK